jgi:hypothetical protein
MSNYTPITDFAAKDTLSSGDPAKIVKGSEVTDELNAIADAIVTKAEKIADDMTIDCGSY